MSDLLDAARRLDAAGLCVVPVKPDGSKSPFGPWKQYQSRRPTDREIEDWLTSGGYDGIGVITGSVSGQLEMFEAEGRAITEGVVLSLAEKMTDHGLAELWQRVCGGYAEVTPSGGMHWYYRVADGSADRNLKLARRPSTPGELSAWKAHQQAGIDAETDPERKARRQLALDGITEGWQVPQVLLETRGEGGFSVTAPSAGRTHPGRGPWTIVAGGPETIPLLTSQEREALHAICSMLDLMPEAPAPSERSRTVSTSDELRPGDDFNRRATWGEILEPHGWRLTRRFGDTLGWARPGKDGPHISATTGRNEADNLYVFSSSTLFATETPYSKFAAFALLEHRGDYAAAASDLRRRGYGSVQTATAPSPDPLVGPVAVAAPEAVPDGQEGLSERERTSWWPRDLEPVLAGRESEPPPVMLTRVDGAHLAYAGRVNGLLGESESGKTWVALLGVQQQIELGRDVVYLDFEDSAAGIVGRLRDMACTDEQLRRLHYIGPDEALSLDASLDLAEALDTTGPSLVVVDGVNAAMTLLGLDLQDNKDATHFAQKVLKPIAKRGAAVIYIDHVPKNKEARGKGGIGAQAKRAMTTGCAIAVDIIAEFGRGQTGKLKLTADKDRQGHVRAVSAGGKRIGTAILTSALDGSITVRIEPAESTTGGTFRPTHLMAKVSRFLETCEGEPSGAAIEREVGGNRENVRAAVNALVEDGFVTRRTAGNATLHRLQMPYIEPVDIFGATPISPTRPISPEARPQASDEVDIRTSPTRPSPKGEGEVRSTVAAVRDRSSDPTSPTHCNDCGTETELRTYEVNQGCCTPCLVIRKTTDG